MVYLGPLVLCFRTSHKAVIKMLVRAGSHLRFDWGSIHFGILWIQLLVNCWTEGLNYLMAIRQRLVTSLPCGSQHRAAYFIEGSKEESLESARKIAVIIICNILIEVAYHYLGHFLLEGSYRSCSHSGGRSYTRA